MGIKVNFEKAKEVAHGHRRQMRELEFAPYDELIAKQIPGKVSEEAEAKRKEIRKKYEEMQVKIDRASDLVQLTAVFK
jgi:hypothetical protein